MRILSDDTLKKIAQIPDSETNPYKKLSASYLAEYDNDDKMDDMDPKLRE